MLIAKAIEISSLAYCRLRRPDDDDDQCSAGAVMVAVDMPAEQASQ